MFYKGSVKVYHARTQTLVWPHQKYKKQKINLQKAKLYNKKKNYTAFCTLLRI